MECFFQLKVIAFSV